MCSQPAGALGPQPKLSLSSSQKDLVMVPKQREREIKRCLFLPIATALNFIDSQWCLGPRRANPRVSIESRNLRMAVPPATLDAEQGLHRPAEMNSKRAKRLCVCHQRKGPSPGTNDANVESYGMHLLTQGIASGEPIWRSRPHQYRRIHQTSQSQEC